MKKLLSFLLTLAMLATMVALPVSAASVTPEELLVSVAYSDTLDLYVTIASNGQLYTSGDGLNWGKGIKLTASIDLGKIEGNTAYVTPDAVIWNGDRQEFVAAVGDKVYISKDGFTWGKGITPKAGSKTLVIHTLFWDGSKYWAGTTTGGQVAYSNDETLTSWTAKGLGSGTQKPVDGFAKADNGRLFATTMVNNAKACYYTDDDTNWTDGTVKDTVPYRPTDMEYSAKLNKVIIVGGNGSSSASTGDGAIARADVVTGATEAKLQLKVASPYVQVPFISDIVISDKYDPETGTITKEEIFAVSFTGQISYRLVGDENDLTKNRKWSAVEPASGVSANTMGLTKIIRGKDGYVAVGGNPANSDLSGTGATAIYIPDDYTLGYKVGSFDDNQTPVAKSIYVTGDDELTIPAQGTTSTGNYTAIVRDIAGKPISDAPNTIVWTVTEAEGISIENGVVTVESTAVEQRIKVTATDSVDSTIYGEKEVIIASSAKPTNINISGSKTLVKSEMGDRTFEYSASVVDSLGRELGEDTGMNGVAWSISFPEENAATGVSVSEEGVLTVAGSATAGEAYVVATSTYPGCETVSGKYKVEITTIGTVTIAGPTNYAQYFKQTTKTPCTYTFVPTVKDALGNTISEECEYSIVEAHSNLGVSLSTSAKGECVLTVSSKAVSDRLTLKATVKNAPEVFGTFTLNIVDTMVPNGDLYEEGQEGNIPANWTNVGTLYPTSLGTSEHHGRWIFQITNATAEDFASFESDAFEVKEGATYRFGFRSAGVKIPTYDESFMPLLYMMVTFHDANGEYVGEPVLIFDTLVAEGKAHSSSADFYEAVKVPEGATNAKVTMTATPPLEFNLYDIGCYPLVDEGNIEISGEESVESGNELQLNATVTDLKYNGEEIALPDGVKWFLKESYSGVSVDNTGKVTVSDKAKRGTAVVVALVSGNSTIYAEKEIEIIVKEYAATEVEVSELIEAGARVSATAKIINTMDDADTAVVIVAVYSAPGVLETCGISEVTTVANDGEEVTISAFADIAQDAVVNENWFAKAFVWNSVDGMTPIKVK